MDMLSGMIPNAPEAAQKAAFFELAPAKINLALHVVGQRADGYHLLESIVTFADTGDRLFFQAAHEDAFSVSGRFAPLLAADPAALHDNLVIRARDLLRAHLLQRGEHAPPVAIHLEKNLPVAAGIGGGSADAAAALRGLIRFWNVTLDDDTLMALGLSLGADVPMCIAGKAMMVKGIGEVLIPLPDLPSLSMVLANPLVGVSTPAIFRQLTTKNNAPIAPRTDGWRNLLLASRNDLEPPARALCPQIGEVSDLLAGEGAEWLRMSGSGATCFAVFAWPQLARAAEETLARRRPDWYFQTVQTVGATPGEKH